MYVCIYVYIVITVQIMSKATCSGLIPVLVSECNEHCTYPTSRNLPGTLIKPWGKERLGKEPTHPNPNVRG